MQTQELKIVKRTKLDDDDWYELYLGERYIKGSYDGEKIKNMYEMLKTNPTALDPVYTVIESTNI